MKGSVRKRGEKWSYYFTIKVDGAYKKKEKGGFRTKKEAETALREVLQQYEKQGFVQNNVSYTLQEFSNYWYENVASNSCRYNTLVQYNGMLKNHIIPELGFIKMTSITPEILQKFFAEKQKSLSNNTIAAIKKVLNNIFKLAIKQMIISYNPLDRLELKKKSEEKKMAIVSLDDLDTIFEDLKDTRYYIPFLIATQVGGRRSEVLGLTWDNVDLENKLITFDKQLLNKVGTGLELSPTKTSSSNRTLLMTDKLVNALLEHRKQQLSNKDFYGNVYYTEQDFVCCNEDGSPIPPESLTSKVTRMSKRLGVDLKFHALRHTHATMLLNAGVNIKVIQERLGHSSITTTLDTYSHVTKEGEVDAIKLFERKFNK